jgi:formylglycine-generating enzyme required for sulfatase activity
MKQSENAIGLRFVATDPANAPVPRRIQTDIFPPDHHIPLAAPPPTVATSPAKSRGTNLNTEKFQNMKTKLFYLFITLALFAGVHQAAAQGTRFFRIAGPAATKITAFRADGSLVWTNSHTGTNYAVQTVTTLPGETNWVDYVLLPVTNRICTNQIFSFNPPSGMTLIPAGVFTLGDTLDKETDAIPVSVTVSGFYMDVNLVSYSQWQSVYSWATSHGYGLVNAGAGKAADHPVQSVDWYDCVKWSNARSQQARLTPVYYTNATLTAVYTNGEVDAVYVKWSANGYRLPTEAEWEKAARGGLSGQRFLWGNTISETNANYNGDTTDYAYDVGPNGINTTYYTGLDPYTSPVGSFAANGYGLYDMAGNIWEWCWDWHIAPPYPAGSPYLGGTDPRGPATGSYRVMRGGDWFYYADYARCANRGFYGTKTATVHNGFRCVRGL